MSEKSGEIIWHCHMATVQVAALNETLPQDDFFICLSSLKRGSHSFLRSAFRHLFMSFKKKNPTDLVCSSHNYFILEVIVRH